MCSSPPSSTEHALVCQRLSCTGESKTGHHIVRRAGTSAKPREKTSSLSLLATLLLKKAQRAVHLCCKGTLLTHVHLVVHYNTKVLSCKATFCPGYCHMGLLLPRCTTSYLLLLNFVMFPPVHFCEGTLNTTSNLQCIDCFPSLVSTMNFLQACSNPSSRCAIKTLSRAGSSISP